MNLKRYRYFFLSITLLSFIILLPDVFANEQYAAKTGKGCIFCHQDKTGGLLNTVGLAYIKNGYRYPIPESVLNKSKILQTPFQQTLRFIIGYLHLLAATVFFGTIFYIHLFIRPTRLTSGIPKQERILGVSCMITLALTGLYLTWTRISYWGQFFDNTFGLLLFIKILLFLLMVIFGLMAITFVHQHMKQEAQGGKRPYDDKTLTKATLPSFDGTEGKPAYVAFENKIYDVGTSPKWKEGRHFGRHQAGQDLTDSLKSAPHGSEVFEKVLYVGDLSPMVDKTHDRSRAQKVFILLAYSNLIIIFLILGCISLWRWGFPVRLNSGTRASMVSETSCIACHSQSTPGIYHDWQKSIHAKVNVDCYACHRTEKKDGLFNKDHLENDVRPIAAVVTPKTCSRCHPKEVAQYAKSKHAHTYEIMWKVDRWLNDGKNNRIERTSGCYACHGTVVKVVNGIPQSGSWPNVGVGRINPDNSIGSCSSCHTRHKFSVVEARKPEACDQCHLGPDHPQIEIYNESKHGTIYHAEGSTWNWKPDNRSWQAGKDYRAPTCTTCHISAAPGVPSTHNVSERLSWELQAPLTIRPQEFTPFPSGTDWKVEREKMEKVCLQCHAQPWVKAHFSNLDSVVSNYNNQYYKPIKGLVDSLYRLGLLSKGSYFDEPLEWEFYEFWHHEGRRARMGAAMMAPDYAWWHGFYELKHRFLTINQQVNDLKKAGKHGFPSSFPGKYQNELKEKGK
ncbi:MAG: multiheme c-type cytochrome [Pseudomonadota bacterium]